MTETAATSITQFLADIGEIGSAVLNQAAEIGEMIVTTPLLLFTTGILFIGGAIGIFGRLLSRS